MPEFVFSDRGAPARAARSAIHEVRGSASGRSRPRAPRPLASDPTRSRLWIARVKSPDDPRRNQARGNADAAEGPLLPLLTDINTFRRCMLQGVLHSPPACES